MPFITRRRLQAKVSFGNDAGTWQYKLPRQGLISSLRVLVEFTNGATNCQDEDVYNAIDRIELVGNGSRVLYSLTGQQARLWTHVFLGKRPNYVRDETPAVAQIAEVLIPFGFTPNDPIHYLDCAMWQDLELRITYSPTIAATAFATGTGYVTVYADMWQMGAPGGFAGMLRITEQYSFTSLASGDVSYDLPIGNPFVALGLYVYEAAISPAANITDVQLDIDDGSYVPVIGKYLDLNTLFSDLLGIDASEYGIVHKSDTDLIETRTGDLLSITLNRVQTLTIGTTDMVHDTVSTIAGGKATLQSSTRDVAAVAADAANSTDGPIEWSAKPKYGLGNFLCIPFGFPNAPDNSIISNNYGRVRFIMTNGNAGADCRLSLIELVTR